MSLRHRPALAITALFAPVALGLLPLFFARVWFLPAPEMALPSLVALIVYYFAVFSIFRAPSTQKGGFLRNAKMMCRSWKDCALATIGLLMFSFLGHQAFFITIPAVVTFALGEESRKVVTVSSIDRVHQSGRCGMKLDFIELSPPFMITLCATKSGKEAWQSGQKVSLYGKESALGFSVSDVR